MNSSPSKRISTVLRLPTAIENTTSRADQISVVRGQSAVQCSRFGTELAGLMGPTGPPGRLRYCQNQSFLGRSRIARGIIRLKPLEKRRRGWIEPELACLLNKKIALRRVVVERGVAYLLNPLLFFGFRFRTPVGVDPFGHVFVASSFG